MSLTDRNGGSVYGVATPATITLCPGATYKELVTSGTTESRLHNWINKSAICSARQSGPTARWVTFRRRFSWSAKALLR